MGKEKRTNKTQRSREESKKQEKGKEKEIKIGKPTCEIPRKYRSSSLSSPLFPPNPLHFRYLRYVPLYKIINLIYQLFYNNIIS
jgi:hypothetical protein